MYKLYVFDRNTSAQSAGAVENANCISEEGLDSLNECREYNIKLDSVPEFGEIWSALSLR